MATDADPQKCESCRFLPAVNLLTSFPKTPHDFEDSKIDAGSGSEVAEVTQPGLVILSLTLCPPPPPPSPALGAHFLTIGANHFPPLTSSAANAERQSVTRALGDATLPAAFRTLQREVEGWAGFGMSLRPPQSTPALLKERRNDPRSSRALSILYKCFRCDAAGEARCLDLLHRLLEAAEQEPG
eukprot:superscaffoldBa00001932_g12555